MTNKQKCALARQIRKGIAEANGIVYLSAACPNVEECTGSCCICEAESKYLDNEINQLVSEGKRITLSNINTNALCSSLEDQDALAIQSDPKDVSDENKTDSKDELLKFCFQTSGNAFACSDSFLKFHGAKLYKKCNFANALFEDLVLTLGKHGIYLADCEQEERADLHSYIERIYRTFTTVLRVEIQEMKLEELYFSIRTFNVLKRAGINKVLDLKGKTKESLAKIRNMGKKSFAEIIDKLDFLGIALPEEEVEFFRECSGVTKLPRLLQTPVEDLRLSEITVLKLKAGKIDTLEDLLKLSHGDFIAILKLESQSIDEIDALLKALGLSLNPS